METPQEQHPRNVGAPTDYESLAKRFAQATTVQEKLVVATEARDGIELIHPQEYKVFLTYLFPSFFECLKIGTPQFQENAEHKLRNTLLEIINRLPNNESLKSFAHNIARLTLFLLGVENEENALICLRIIVDLHKNHRQVLEAEVQPFLDLVQRLYNELPKTVAATFKDLPKIAANNMAGAEKGAKQDNLQDPQKATAFFKADQSFKVLTECPIIVVLLLQLYPKFLGVNIRSFIPLVVNTIAIVSPSPPKALATPSQELLNRMYRATYNDFVAAQVKTLSFLAYMMRSYADHLKQYSDTIPKSVIGLLQNCPSESASTRKELLIATRHILATDFRTGFIQHIDTLLDEKVLIGSGKTAHETLRPLAFSTLADLIHHIRADLNYTQLQRVVHLYTRNLHDGTLPFSIQTMSVKLLLNLVEGIAKKNDDAQRGRSLLVRILDVSVNKFSSLKKQIPKLIQKQNKNKGTDNIKDCRILMRTLVLGLKNIMWGISNCQAQTYARGNQAGGQAAPPSVPQRFMTPEESLMFTSLLKNGLKCFQIFTQGNNPSPTEEKDTLDHFAAVFTMVDPKIFQDAFSTQMPFLFDRIIENQAMLNIPQHFLANPQCSKYFADVLLGFLIDRIKLLSGSDKTVSSVLLRLFKLVFGSITLFHENEPILQPHLAVLITQTMKHATEVKESNNYFVLLRALFRSVGSGKFDFFYKEFLPLLPSMLETLTRLQNSAPSPNLRDLYVELALTIPVRLSSLLPFLKYIMKPLVIALESSNELVSNGLRTLELCLDNMNPSFVNPILNEVKVELMNALWRHLKPSPYTHGPQALRVLGKLAGRNRDFLQIPPKLKSEEFKEQSLTANINFGDVSIPLSLDKSVYHAKRKLGTHPDFEGRKQAYLFVRSVCNSIITTFPLLSMDANGEVVEGNSPPQHEVEALRHRVRTVFESVIVAAATDKLSETIGDYMEGLCRHFAMIISKQRSLKPKLDRIDSFVFIEAIVEVMCSENRMQSKPAAKALDHLLENLQVLHAADSDKSSVGEYEQIQELALRFTNSCYLPHWYCKNGASSGIFQLANKMNTDWLRSHQLQFLKGLIFIIKDIQPDISVATVEEATEAFHFILKTCNSEDRKEVKPSANEENEFQQLIKMLTTEVASHNSNIRSLVQNALGTIATSLGRTVHSLVEPFKDDLLGPILARPLKDVAHASQPGYLDALAFCINLRPCLVVFGREVMDILRSALTIADKDESIAQEKQMSQKNLNLLTTLKIASIDLLAAAMVTEQFAEQEFRNKVVGVFFKTLTLRNREIVEVARKGLAQVYAQQKLWPKELLQSSLRPVLLNLADFRKLSVPLLHGLARLLELLTNSFNVTLGEKLLEHLGKWAEPIRSGKSSWKEGEETKIAAGIIDIFHLLPAAASKFLEPLVAITIQLEQNLPRENGSPYRVPLIRYLNRYRVEAIDYFFARLAQPQYSKILRYLIREKEADALREEIALNITKLIANTFKASNTTQFAGFELPFQGLLIINILVKFLPQWLSQSQNKPVLDCLVEMWNSPARTARLTNDDNLPLPHLRESKLIAKCLLNYCENNHGDVNILFSLLSIFTVRTTMDYSFLMDFYQIKVAETYKPAEKRAIIVKFLELYKDKEVSLDHKVQTIQVFIIPLLNSIFAKEEHNLVLDPKITSTMMSDIFDSNEHKASDEALNIETLQLASLLIKSPTPGLSDHKKELIKFAWGFLKSDDLTTKQHAYVMVSRYVELFETPPKIVLQVYHALLKAHQMEAKALVKTALDVLVPKLNDRLKDTHNWVKWTKKIIVEEGYSMVQLTHILQLIHRHYMLFYPSRGQFVPHMVNSLARIGLLGNAPQENKKLSLDLADVMIQWEKRHIAESVTKPEDSMEIDSKKETEEMEIDSKKNPLDNYKINSQISETIVNFLVRMASTNVDNADEKMPANHPHAAAVAAAAAAAKEAAAGGPSLLQRSLDLLNSAVSIWPEVVIKFLYFEKMLSNAEQPASVVSTALNILSIMMDHGLHRIIIDHLQLFCNALNPVVLNTSNQKIVTSFCTLLQKIMQAFPPLDKDSPMTLLYNHVANSLENSLNSNEQSHVHCTVLILKTFLVYNPAASDRYLAFIVKSMLKLTKDHINPPKDAPEEPTQTLTLRQGTPAANAANTAANAAGTAASATAKSKIVKDTASSLSICIHIVTRRISSLNPDQRKLFFANLTALLEKSSDQDLLIELVRIIGSWITGSSFNPTSSASSSSSQGLNTSSSVPSTPHTGSQMTLESPIHVSSPVRTSEMKQENLTPQQGTSLTGSDVELGNSILNNKEKVAFLVKMARFETTVASLHHSYLELVNFIFNDSSFNRTELSLLDNGFMTGLRSKDTNLRNSFVKVLDGGMSKNLLERFENIIKNQNWENMNASFWIKQALDLLFCLAQTNKPFYSNSHFTTSNIFNRDDDAMMTDSTESKSETIEDKLGALKEKQTKFMEGAKGGTIGDVLNYFKELIHGDNELAFQTWVQLFPNIWQTATNNAELIARLTQELTVFLARDYHMKQVRSNPNVIQAFVEGIHNCSFPPKLSVDLLKFLAKTFNVWHPVIALLERQSIGAPTETENYVALSDLYNILGEKDLYYAILKKKLYSDETSAALTFEQHGQWAKAQEAFQSCLFKAQTGAKTATYAETCLWEEHWIKCGKQLGQWEILTEYAKGYNLYDLLLETCWKVGDWNATKEAVNKVGGDSTTVKIVQSYIAIHEGRIGEVEPLVNLGIQSALKTFMTLPEVPSLSHIPVLQQFQKLLELRDSATILKESKIPTSNDFKGILTLWRDRVPNDWEDVVFWGDILMWRQQNVLSVMSNATQIPPEGGTTNALAIQLGHNETAWCINKFAHIARKHDLIDLCLSQQAKIYSLPNIEMNDAFTKFREQIKCYINNPSTWRLGLDNILSTHTDFFSPQQKSEFLRLKGEFLWKLGQGDEANSCFYSAIQTFENSSQSWLSWGKMCDHQWTETKDIQWAEHAISCYLQAARGNEKCRSYLSRALYLLDCDDESERLLKAFEKGLEGLPLWVWVVYIPYLLSSFKRSESTFVKTLQKIAGFFPQAVYFPLRTFYKSINPTPENILTQRAAKEEEEMEITNTIPVAPITAPATVAPGIPAAVAPTPTAIVPPSTSSPRIRQTPSHYAEELIKYVQMKSQSLIFDLERMAEEICSGLAPTPEEILLTNMEWIIMQTYSLNLTVQTVPENIKKRLNSLAEYSIVPSDHKDYQTSKKKYIKDLVADFENENALDLLVTKIQKWILLLEEVVESIPKKIPLKDLSPFLAEFQNTTVEIPGQYFQDAEPSADLHIRLDRILSPVHIVNRKRIIQMRGTNGKIYNFMIETDYVGTDSFVNGSQERVQRLYRIINKWISSHRETRKRNIYFHIPNTISLSPTTRLVQIPDIEHFSLDTPYKKYCLQVGQKDTYSPLYFYKAKITQKDTLEGRLGAYHHITKSIPDEMFKKYTESLFPSPVHFFAFRKQAASQLAIHSLLSYIFGIKNALPENLFFFKSSGTLMQSDFFPVFQEDGKIDCNELTPFRLSRNLSSFLGNLMVDGTLHSSMNAASLCLNHNKDILRNQLSLYLKEELIATKFQEPTLSEDKKAEINWKKKVIACVEPNVDKVMEKLNSTISSSEKSGRISKLLENAQQPRYFVQNSASWQPWI